MNNNLLIVPSNIKEKILEEQNKKEELVNTKIMTLKEFINHYYFTYDKKTIYYLSENYNLKVSTAIEYLNNLIYIEDKKYNSKKLNNLVEIKKDLINNNLLTYDPLFKELLKNYNINVEYPNLDKFYINIFDSLNAKYMDVEKYQKRELKAFKFLNIEEEVSFVANSISELLLKNININNIKLLNVTSEYPITIKRIFKLFNIPVDLKESKSIYETEIGLSFLNSIKDNKSFDEIIDSLKENYSESNIINKIINICNQYYWYKDETKKLYNYLVEDLKNTRLTNKYSSRVESISIDEIKEEDYAFLLGFNNENIPVTHKDDSLFSDKEKNELNLKSVEELNIEEKQKIIDVLYKYNNIIVTYKKKTPFASYNHSSLVEELNIEIIEKKYNYFNSHSNKYNELMLGKNIDNYIKYGILNDELILLFNNYYNQKYLNYDNKFKGINKSNYFNYLNNSLKLSYSSIDNYFKCGFRYYLSNVLKVEEFETDFKRNIGNIFHYILSKKDKPDFNLDEEWDYAIKDYEFNKMEKFYLNKLKKELEFTIKNIEEQKRLTGFNEELHEEKIEVNIENEIPTIFKGFIDKIMYLEEDNTTYLSIIDYKTGTLHTKLNNLPYGLGMQLPIYLYLVKRTNKFTNPKITGFYLQKIIHEEFKILTNKTYNDQRKESLKLVGQSLANTNILEKFDISYFNSELIKGMKVKNDGNFYSTSKVVTEENIDEIDKIIDKNIKEATKEITNANFDINPKKVGKDLLGCEYCNYKDICYFKQEDIVKLKEYKDLSFLGGDDNA